MKTKHKNKLLLAATLLLGLFLGWVFFGGNGESKIHEHAASKQTETTVWTCSMHPQVRSSSPGDCPICGMDLIPVEKKKCSKNPEAVSMSEYAMKLANVQTMEVGKTPQTNIINLNGKIAVDERLSYTQSTHVPGRVERLYVNFTGEEVNRGQALAQIYSPKLVTAQAELLQAYAIRESNPRLFEAAKTKLRNWKVSEAQIEQILKSGKATEQFTIYSDVGGIVTKKMVELGDYLERGMPLYEIADLSRVWALFDIYESSMAFLQEGDTVQFTVASIPGKTFSGKIDFIDPMINPQTRVSTARLVVENENGLLKPGMLVEGIIKSSTDEKNSKKITIPKSAVLWTGKRSVVYVKKAPHTFEAREVVLGPSLGNSYVIAKGLKIGDTIVVNGVFSVDSAAQLAGKPSMMGMEE